MAVDYATLKKGGFMRQKQKNNFSLRIRVVGGTLTAKQLAVVSEVGRDLRKRICTSHLPSGVEIPFIKLEQIDEVKDALAKGGVVPGVCGPRVRTVTACQALRSVRADVSIPTRWHRSWMRDILVTICRINSNSVSPDVRTTA